MTRDELAQAIDAYAAGLEAQLALLRQLLRLSEQQRAADLPAITRLNEERAALMRALVGVEAQIRPVRLQLHASQLEAASLDGFQDLITLHRVAGNLVSTILAADQDTLRALQEAELARQFASQTLDAGENTLAAYRKVVSPGPAAASIVNRRG